MRFFMLTFIFLCLFSPVARGEDSNANDKEHFSRMDTNQDGKISWEEFHLSYPSLKQAAFDSIDQNRDGFIDIDEWSAFRTVHGKRHPHMELPGADDPAPDMPLIRPPDNTNNQGKVL